MPPTKTISPSNGPESLIESIASRRTALTVEDLAETLALSKRAIYDMVASKKIPHFRVGVNVRFDPSTTATWLRSITSI